MQRNVNVIKVGEDDDWPPPYYESATPLNSSKIHVGINLARATANEWHFLRYIDRQWRVLYNKEVLRNAVRRYEHVWLPLLVCFINNMQ